MRFPRATQEAERLKSCGHLHYRYITYSKATNSRNMMWIGLFPHRLPPSADHITFLTGFTFLPWGCLSHCCINDLEPCSSSAASSYWFFFCRLIIKNTPLRWPRNSCNSLHGLGIQCSLTYAPLWEMRNLLRLLTSLPFKENCASSPKCVFLVVKWGHAGVAKCCSQSDSFKISSSVRSSAVIRSQSRRPGPVPCAHKPKGILLIGS